MLTLLSNFSQRATNLIQRGLSVIPAKPNSKEPIAGLGVRSRSNDPVVVAEWTDRYPDANVAVCADGNVAILDADDAEAMEQEIGKVATYTVQSSLARLTTTSRSATSRCVTSSLECWAVFVPTTCM